jgi:hypothetical protein
VLFQQVSWCKTPVNVPGIGRKMYESEIAFQIYCADWLRKQFELTNNPKFERWHHSANEREGGRAGFIAKMMGQSKGFPDFIHCCNRVAIELKLPGRMPSRHQVDWLKHLSGAGWLCEIVFTFERFVEIIESIEQVNT